MRAWRALLAWITQGFEQHIPQHLQGLRLVTWFDVVHTDQEGTTFDWRIGSSDTSLTAYRAVVALPSWHRTLP